MKELRIIFMGTPDFAVGVLNKLIKAECTIVGVITAPDRPAGRGKKLRASAVKKFAIEHGLNVLQPTNLKSKDFNEQLSALQPDLQIVVAFRMLPEVVWKLPKHGTFNLHASLLPDYRGAAPINWAVINGDDSTGVTTFFIDEKIDTGEVILQEEVPIEDEDSAGDLHDKLMDVGAQLVLKTVKAIADGNVSTTKQQDSEKNRPAPKLHKDTCRIDWTKGRDEIKNLVRGLSPYPTAWTNIVNGSDEIPTKVFKVSTRKEEHDNKIGSLEIGAKKLRVAVKDGYVYLEDLQLAGKKRMDGKALLNGFRLHEDAYVR